jgi:AcrR family transcriptional regulator
VSEVSRTSLPQLRRDAAENRARILAAARVIFDEEGLDAGMDEIARRAGVGVGTVYRRFDSKEELIAAALADLPAQLRELIAAAEEADSVADGFFGFLAAVGELQAAHVGCLSRLWSSADAESRTETTELGRALLERAQAAGVVRADLVYEDVSMLFWSLQGVIERTLAVHPDAWRRHLELLISGLRPGGEALAGTPLSPAEADAIGTRR